MPPALSPTPPVNPSPGTNEPSLIGAAGTEPPAGEPPPSEPPAVEPPAPLAWADIELPEGVEVPEDLQTEFLGLLNNGELDRKGLAKEMLTLHTKLADQFLAELQDGWKQTQEQWRKDTLALPEFRGVQPEAQFAEVARIMNRYGNAEARAAFDETGAGNHPAIVQMFLKIAKDINEAPPVSGDPPPPTPLSREQRLYGNSGG